VCVTEWSRKPQLTTENPTGNTVREGRNKMGKKEKKERRREKDDLRSPKLTKYNNNHIFHYFGEHIQSFGETI
jgi:hypothetical protein